MHDAPTYIRTLVHIIILQLAKTMNVSLPVTAHYPTAAPHAGNYRLCYLLQCCILYTKNFKLTLGLLVDKLQLYGVVISLQCMALHILLVDSPTNSKPLS